MLTVPDIERSLISIRVTYIRASAKASYVVFVSDSEDRLPRKYSVEPHSVATIPAHLPVKMMTSSIVLCGFCQKRKRGESALNESCQPCLLSLAHHPGCLVGAIMCQQVSLDFTLAAQLLPLWAMKLCESSLQLPGVASLQIIHFHDPAEKRYKGHKSRVVEPTENPFLCCLVHMWRKLDSGIALSSMAGTEAFSSDPFLLQPAQVAPSQQAVTCTNSAIAAGISAPMD